MGRRRVWQEAFHRRDLIFGEVGRRSVEVAGYSEKG